MAMAMAVAVGLLVLCAAVDRSKFRTCEQTGFCRRYRAYVQDVGSGLLLRGSRVASRSKPGARVHRVERWWRGGLRLAGHGPKMVLPLEEVLQRPVQGHFVDVSTLAHEARPFLVQSHSIF